MTLVQLFAILKFYFIRLTTLLTTYLFFYSLCDHITLHRTLLAILENNQQPDGSITIPEALRPYMNNLQSIQVPTLEEGGKVHTSIYSSLWKQ